MNCREFHERIVSAVDHRLSLSEEADFQNHSHKCPPCEREYKIDAVAKTLVQKFIRFLPVPEDLRQLIVQQTLRIK